MNVKIKATESFKRQAKPLLKKYLSLKDELKVLETQLIENPTLGTKIGENIYKIRLAVKSKGKSGGLRVVTYLDTEIVVEETSVILIAIYDKSETASISEKEIKELLDDLGE